MPPFIVSQRAAAEHERTRRALLDVEARAHHALVVSVGDRGSFKDPIVASREMGARVAPMVLAARGVARRVAGQRMQDEINVGIHDGGPRIHLEHNEHAKAHAADRLAAERASREYSDALIREAMKVLDDADSATAGQLVGATDAALESIATNEVATAFSDERRRIERATKKQYDGTNWFPAMLKIWDATLDRATCNRCRDLDGKARPWGIDFAGGLTTPAHRKCRCIECYVFSPLYLGRKESHDRRAHDSS